MLRRRKFLFSNLFQEPSASGPLLVRQDSQGKVAAAAQPVRQRLTSRQLPGNLASSARRRNSINKKLYVGNLSYQTSQSQLEAFSAEAGEVVEAVVVEDRYSGRSRGFGFVEMATEEAAAARIEQFHGRELDGRTLNVAEARPPRRREDRGGYDERW